MELRNYEKHYFGLSQYDKTKLKKNLSLLQDKINELEPEFNFMDSTKIDYLEDDDEEVFYIVSLWALMTNKAYEKLCKWAKENKIYFSTEEGEDY